MPNELVTLTPDDWRALASLDPSARDIEILDPAMLRRWHDAYIVSGLGGAAAQVLSFGQGVIAAARMLVHGTSSVAAAWAEADRANAEIHRLRARIDDLAFVASSGRPEEHDAARECGACDPLGPEA